MSLFSPNTIMALQSIKLQPKFFSAWLCGFVWSAPRACLTSSPSLSVAHSASATLACLLLFRCTRHTLSLGLYTGTSSTYSALSTDMDMTDSLTTFDPCSNISFSWSLSCTTPRMPDTPNHILLIYSLLFFCYSNFTFYVFSNLCMYDVCYTSCFINAQKFIVLFGDN